MKEKTISKEKSILKSLLVVFVLVFAFMLTSCGEPVVKHTVSFESNDGSEVAEVEVVSGETFTKPTNPTRSGYTFDAWYKETALTTVWNFETDKVEADTTLYAGWKITLEHAKELKVAEVNALLGGYEETDYSETNWFAMQGIISVAVADVNALTTVATVEGFDVEAVGTALAGVRLLEPIITCDRSEFDVDASGLFNEVDGKITVENFDAETLELPNFEVGITIGTNLYESTRFIIEVTNENGNVVDGIQLIAQDSEDTWWNMVTVGWGPSGGAPTIKDDSTTVYVVASVVGEYTVTVKLIDVDKYGKITGEPDAGILATLTGKINVTEAAE